MLLQFVPLWLVASPTCAQQRAINISSRLVLLGWDGANILLGCAGGRPQIQLDSGVLGLRIAIVRLVWLSGSIVGCKVHCCWRGPLAGTGLLLVMWPARLGAC